MAPRPRRRHAADRRRFARHWRSFEAAEQAKLEWADWFNNRRPLKPIENIPPTEGEVNFYATPDTDPLPRD